MCYSGIGTPIIPIPVPGKRESWLKELVLQLHKCQTGSKTEDNVTELRRPKKGNRKFISLLFSGEVLSKFVLNSLLSLSCLYFRYSLSGVVEFILPIFPVWGPWSLYSLYTLYRVVEFILPIFPVRGRGV